MMLSTGSTSSSLPLPLSVDNDGCFVLFLFRLGSAPAMLLESYIINI